MVRPPNISCSHLQRAPKIPLWVGPLWGYRDGQTSFCSLPAKYRDGLGWAFQSSKACKGVFLSTSEWSLGDMARVDGQMVPTKSSVCFSSSADSVLVASWSCRLWISNWQASKSAPHTFPRSGHLQLKQRGNKGRKTYSVMFYLTKSIACLPG